MSELHIQSFLRNGGTLEDLEKNWAIKSKPSEVYPNLVLFKYDQINSPMAAPIVQECRGLILDMDRDWDIVAFPFVKFFNYGEPLAHPIKWETAKVYEKLDGSLITLYWYGDNWRVATSGNPDAAGQVGDHDFTFADYFWKTFKDQNYKLPPDHCKSATLMFELTGPYNRIVVDNKESEITLLGYRSNISGQELPIDVWAGCYKLVRSYDLSSLEDIIKSLEAIDPIAQEGYVVRDGKFNRIKIKSPAYVALHHMKDSLSGSRKTFIDIVRRGETPEFLAHFPEFTESFNDIKLRYENLVAHLQEAYAPIAGIATQKEFAFEALKARVPDCLFRLRKGAVPSVKQYLAEMPIERLVEALGL